MRTESDVYSDQRERLATILPRGRSSGPPIRRASSLQDVDATLATTFSSTRHGRSLGCSTSAGRATTDAR